jgi:predicted HAD superfamily hydrolase
MELLRRQSACENVDNTDSMHIVDNMLTDIERRHSLLIVHWPVQRQALQIAGKFRLFEQDCTTVRTLI